MDKHLFRKIFVGIMLCLFILPLEAGEMNVIAVLPDDIYPYSFQENGEMKGYLVDYLSLAAEKAGYGISFEKTQYAFETINETMDGMEIKDEPNTIYIVLSGPNRTIPDTFIRGHNIGELHIPVAIYSDLADIPLAETLSGVPVGVLYDYKTTPVVESIYPEAEILNYNTPLGVLKAAESRDILAFVPTSWPGRFWRQNLILPPNFSLIESPTLYFATITKVQNFAAKQFIQNLPELSPEEYAELQTRWGLDSESGGNTEPVFTEEEREWIKGLQEINIGIPMSYFPAHYSFMLSKSRGSIANLELLFKAFLQEIYGTDDPINENLDLEIDIIDSIEEDVRKGDVDIVLPVAGTSTKARYLDLTKPILITPIVIVGHNSRSMIQSFNEIKDSSIAVVADSAAHDELRQDYPNMKLHVFKNAYQAMQAVRFKKIDYFVGELTTVSVVLQKINSSDLRIEATTPYTSQMCIGVRKDWPQLTRVLNRYIGNLPGEQEQELFEGLITDSSRYIINWVIIWQVMLAISVTFGIIVCIILIWNRKLAKEVYKKEEAKKHLAKANQALKKSNEAKSQFLANMSHEIRTPMNAIIGLTHLCLKTGLNPKQKEYVEKINKSAHSLLGIINDILDFSKIEAGKMSLDNVLFLMDDVLDNIQSMVGEVARRKGLDFQILKDQTLPKILVGDPLRLGQILLNLGSNAVKFTERGEITIKLRVLKKDKNDLTIEFSVKDTGIGLTEDQQAALFQPFIQADGSTSRKFGGTGLGLAISRQLTEMMNGTIGVTSQFGSGSEFMFTAEFHIPSQNKVKQFLSGLKDQEKNFNKEQFAHARVLLVEDNEINRQVAVEILEDAGIKVETANNGREAVDMLQEDHARYDAVLMDVLMPVMDGYEATRNIRNTLKLEQLPIIAMTASAMAGDKEKSLDVGMDDYISKPIDPAKLFEVLSKYIRMSWDIRPDRKQISLPNHVFPERLPGISIKDGLNRMANNKSLYQRMLIKFRESYAGFMDEILEALHERDFETAMRGAHTLKSTAGNIGASLLSSAAGDLEKKIKNNPKAVNDDDLKELMLEMTLVLAGLDSLPDAEESIEDEEKKPVVGKHDILKALEELKPHVRAKKPKPCKAFIEHMQRQKCQCQAINDEGIKELIDLLKKYKYKEAEACIDNLIQKLNLDEGE